MTSRNDRGRAARARQRLAFYLQGEGLIDMMVASIFAVLVLGPKDAVALALCSVLFTRALLRVDPTEERRIPLAISTPRR